MADENGSSPKNSPEQKPGGGPPNVKLSRNVVSWMVLLGLAMLLVALLSDSFSQSTKISISKFETLIDNQNIKELSIRDTEGVIEGRMERLAQGEPPNTPLNFTVNYPREAIDSAFITGLNERLPDAEIKIDVRASSCWYC